MFRPGGSFHQWINNSANPVIISPNWMIQGSGAAVGSSIWFQGTGDFCITNNLRSNSGTGNPIPVSWDNTGTTFWAEGFPGGNGTNNSTNLFNTQLGAVTISAGSTLVITTPRLLPLYTYGVSGNTVTHNGTLLKFALSGIGGSSDTIPRVISGTGAVMVVNGTITFTATNTYTGLTTVSNGTLLVNGRLGIGGVNVWGGRLGGSGSILGPVNIGSAGTLSPGNSIGTLTINSNLTIGGNLAIEVGKSPFDPSLLNDHVVVGGGLVNTGVGTLTVSQPSPFGSSLVPGDKFTLFNKPVQNGGALTVTGAGVGWINQLEVDGSIIVSP
ncbi:MAG TPA: hypothetical protein PKA41_15675, partial [Verrucomicrobiota bacterium]|nr:hypothetical protein [Verrucomicrobiota bacterium]